MRSLAVTLSFRFCQDSKSKTSFCIPPAVDFSGIFLGKSGSTDVAVDLSLMACCLVFPAASYRRGCVRHTLQSVTISLVRILPCWLFRKGKKESIDPVALPGVVCVCVRGMAVHCGNEVQGYELCYVPVCVSVCAV